MLIKYFNEEEFFLTAWFKFCQFLVVNYIKDK